MRFVRGGDWFVGSLSQSVLACSSTLAGKGCTDTEQQELEREQDWGRITRAPAPDPSFLPILSGLGPYKPETSWRGGNAHVVMAFPFRGCVSRHYVQYFTASTKLVLKIIDIAYTVLPAVCCHLRFGTIFGRVLPLPSAECGAGRTTTQCALNIDSFCHARNISDGHKFCPRHKKLVFEKIFLVSARRATMLRRFENGGGRGEFQLSEGRNHLSRSVSAMRITGAPSDFLN